MGKIRIKTIGVEDIEEQEKKEKQIKKAEKKARIAADQPKKEEINTDTKEDSEAIVNEAQKEDKPQEKKEKQVKKAEKKAIHSLAYVSLSEKVDKSKTYSLSDALSLLEGLQRGKFDETVELHINTTASGISGSVTLPHGTGKKTKVAVVDDSLIAEIEKGKISFDILIAHPSFMPKLARVAKVLGPRGLMPNPKNGTISPTPEEVAKKYEGGQINFKTEAKSPILHLSVGKMSFGAQKLSDNIQEMIKAVKKANIVNVTLKSTMSPGIKIKI